MNTNYVIIGVIALIAFLFLFRSNVRVLQTGDDSQLEAKALEALITDRQIKAQQQEAREERQFQKELLLIERDTLLQQKKMDIELKRQQEERYYAQLQQEREAEKQMQDRYYASQERIGFLQLIGSAIGTVFSFIFSDAEYYNEYAKRFIPYKAGELALMGASNYRGKNG